MTWIELHDTVIDHPKVIDAADILDISNVTMVGHLAALWTWAIDSAPDGCGLTARAIAAGARWNGDHAAFADALLSTGLLDRDGERFAIHNWDRYSGKLIDQRDMRRLSNREAQRRRRQRMKVDESAVSQRTRQHDNDDNQQSTVPYLTVPNRSDQISASAPEQEPEDTATEPLTPLKRLWQVYTELTLRPLVPVMEEEQLDIWVKNGVTIEQINDALRNTAAEQPKKPWPYFKAVLSQSLVKLPKPAPKHIPTLTAEQVQALRERAR